MLTILKNLKKSVAAIVFVTILLILQAYCDLSLPSYTSDIVNVGILQGGIDSPVPEVIRSSELDKLLLFMEPKEQETVLKHYTELRKDNTDPHKWTQYLKKYPLLEAEALSLWDKKEEALLEEILPLPFLIKMAFESDSEEVNLIREQLIASMPPGSVDESMDLITIMGFLPVESRSEVITSMKERILMMPELLLGQSAVTFVKQEYETIGVNVNGIQTRYIVLVGAMMLGLALAAMLASILVTFLSARIAARIGRDLRSNVFKKVLSFSNTEMDRFSTASLITRSTNDVQQVQILIVMMIRIVIYSPILALGGIFKIVNTNTTMTWTLGAGVGAVFSLILILLIVAMPKFKLMQKLVDRVNLVMREILTGLPVIRAFSNEKHENKRFDEANVNLTKNSLFVGRVMTFMMPALMLIMNLVSILIIWVGADRINEGTMQAGDMMAFIQYTIQIIMSFLMLTMISIILPRAGVSAKRINEVLKVDAVISDPQEEAPMDARKKGLLEFKNVHFRYPNAEEDVLYDISFIAQPGETTAIIGSTGSGKTTLVNLIPRFYDITKGNILLNGTDIRDISRNRLRDKLGFVPQRGILFSGTIKSNISFGNPEASDETIRKAARIAQAAEFIENKPDGYEDPISEGGTNVSGGQKQRLSIARAIAKQPEIYIFDDSFSALDFKTDAALRRALKEELSDSTVILVAQRVSTIMNAEQILVLDEGRIVGKGTHKQLLKECDVYRQIASSQLTKEELAYE